MAETDLQALAPAARRRSGLVAAAGLAALAIGLVWAERIDIAHRVIDRQIRQLKLSARYRIDEIGAGREVLSDISLGDPANPDLVVERLEIDTGWNGGLPAITGLKLAGARLRGKFTDGQLSFGSLDHILFAPTHARFRLPDIALRLRDASASIGGDHGPIGIAIDGNGNLRNGFTGTAAMVAPLLRIDGCALQAARLHGPIVVRAEQPQLIGAVHIAELTCASPALAIQAPAGHLDVRLTSRFDGGTAHFAVASGAARLTGIGAARLAVGGDADLRGGVLTSQFTAGADRVFGPSFVAAQLGVAGRLRGAVRDGSWQGDGTLSGRGLTPEAQTMLARAADTGAGTIAGPLLTGLRSGVARETPADRLSASWSLQRSANGDRLVLPELHIDGGDSAHWLSASQVVLQRSTGTRRIAVAGKFAMVGRNFPQLRGEVRPLADGGGVAMLAMPSWTAGPTSLALPILAVHWKRDGAVGFDGRAVLSGPLPGGQVSGLALPLQGSWSTGAGLRVGNRCTGIAFDRLSWGGLALSHADRTGQALTLCPGAGGGAMVALNTGGLHVSVRAAGLGLDGRMNGDRLKIATGAAMLNWPGALTVRDIDLAATDAAAHVHVAQVTASLGAATTGQFSSGDADLATVPVVVRSAAGGFRWAGGRLTVDGAGFRVEDPAPHPNFAPIIVHDGTLAMADGVITAAASLRASAANRELVGVTLAHDLASNTGHAELSVPGLVFDKALQPKQLSALAEGVIADAKGTLTGHGRFDWDHGRVTSSGTIATKPFDFAAAFGPVTGVSGEVVFTDLIGLVTAPEQRLAIATINPGIEVDDGVLTFALQPGHVLAVSGAKWPFLDGQLTLLSTRLVLGATEVRHYLLHVDALNAAKFLARMDLSNLAATGTFDGDLPLVFDESGGRIEQGLLRSRAPGGTVSYVGALTYKDLSPMANYAFQALRALKYRQMRIGMDGALAGDIVTRVSMQGVGQGVGAKRNFITNQIARLPIQFDVNVTAPFMQLVTSFRSLYDPAMVADPRTLGLIDAQGRAVAHPAPGKLPAAENAAGAGADHSATINGSAGNARPS